MVDGIQLKPRQRVTGVFHNVSKAHDQWVTDKIAPEDAAVRCSSLLLVIGEDLVYQKLS